jgi:hypothetical protein
MQPSRYIKFEVLELHLFDQKKFMHKQYDIQVRAHEQRCRLL